MKIPAAHKTCPGCGISLHDGYVVDCPKCQDRRHGRLKVGERFSPTCYAGEWIDNQDRKGRIVSGAGASR